MWLAIVAISRLAVSSSATMLATTSSIRMTVRVRHEVIGCCGLLVSTILFLHLLTGKSGEILLDLLERFGLQMESALPAAHRAGARASLDSPQMGFLLACVFDGFLLT